MNYHLIIHDNAIADAEEIFTRIALDSPEQAQLWHNRLRDLLATLLDFRQRCPLAPESARFPIEVRHLLFGNYRILFTVREETVHVLHIRHAARRPAQPNE